MPSKKKHENESDIDSAEHNILRELDSVIHELKRTVTQPQKDCDSSMVDFKELVGFYHCLLKVTKELYSLHTDYENCLMHADSKDSVLKCLGKMRKDMEKSTFKMVSSLNDCKKHLKCHIGDKSKASNLVNCLSNASSQKGVNTCFTDK